MRSSVLRQCILVVLSQRHITIRLISIIQFTNLTDVVTRHVCISLSLIVNIRLMRLIVNIRLMRTS